MFVKTATVVGLAAAVASLVAQPGPPQQRRHNRIVDLLAQDKVVFGWFAPGPTPEAAARAASDARMDFVFLNMEQVRNYNPPAIKTFLQAMADAGARRRPAEHPLMTRLPIFHDDPDAARQRIAEVLNLGVHAVVFPDMESAEEATQALAAMRYPQPPGSKHADPTGVRPAGAGQAPDVWGLPPDDYRRRADVYPLNPDGELASIFIVESVKGIENSREITRARPTVMIPGPGTLRRVYQGDAAKVEAAIQTQLASCKEFKVPCGITANAGDVAKRIQEGFRMIIIYDRDYAETIAAGRAAAGRN
jgi:2-keto-3-deoxy-L-rhamnonate aldolase RhmA